MSLSIARHLDLTDLQCPFPASTVAESLGELKPGDLIEILSRDPAAASGVSALALSTGDALLESSRLGSTFRFVIRRR